MEQVQWKFNFFNGADAQKCYEELGGDVNLTPEQIVQKAKDENTELHKCFEWDDKKAANKYRLTQARTIICNLVYVSNDTEEHHEPIRLFYKPDAESGYKSTKMILKNPLEYEALLEQCKTDLEQLKAKYHTLSEYDWLWKLVK